MLQQTREPLDAPDDAADGVEHAAHAVEMPVGALHRALDLPEERDRLLARIASTVSRVASSTRNVFKSTRHRNRTRSAQNAASTIDAVSPPVR